MNGDYYLTLIDRCSATANSERKHGNLCTTIFEREELSHVKLFQFMERLVPFVDGNLSIVTSRNHR